MKDITHLCPCLHLAALQEGDVTIKGDVTTDHIYDVMVPTMTSAITWRKLRCQCEKMDGGWIWCVKAN